VDNFPGGHGSDIQSAPNELGTGGNSMKPAARESRGAVQAKKLRDRAEECRSLARMMTNGASYLRFADAYDALAEQQEQLARDIAQFNIKTRRPK
jgi:hypothetical protein